MGFNTPGAASRAADLEAPEAPKSRPKPQKIDVENQHVFGIDFRRVRTSFWKGFGMIFGRKNAPKPHKHAFLENLKNIDFPKGKLIFSRFRRLKISKVWATMA